MRIKCKCDHEHDCPKWVETSNSLLEQRIDSQVPLTPKDKSNHYKNVNDDPEMDKIMSKLGVDLDKEYYGQGLRQGDNDSLTIAKGDIALWEVDREGSPGVNKLLVYVRYVDVRGYRIIPFGYDADFIVTKEQLTKIDNSRDTVTILGNR